MAQISFTLNGRRVSLSTDGSRALLWVLRTDLGLTGTKFGCGQLICGACTVLVDGEPTRSCRLPVSAVAGKKVVTIEGLARGDELHPVQKAFVDHDALQCGFCTSGMILTICGLLEKNVKPTRAEIEEYLEDNLCRCGAHTRILDAVESAAKVMARR